MVSRCSPLSWSSSLYPCLLSLSFFFFSIISCLLFYRLHFWAHLTPLCRRARCCGRPHCQSNPVRCVLWQWIWTQLPVQEQWRWDFYRCGTAGWWGFEHIMTLKNWNLGQNKMQLCFPCRSGGPHAAWQRGCFGRLQSRWQDGHCLWELEWTSSSLHATE